MLEIDYLPVGRRLEIVVQPSHDVHAAPPPAEDRLPMVSDACESPRVAYELGDHSVLNRVDVLHLIDNQMTNIRAYCFEQVGAAAEKPQQLGLRGREI
ncbi:MAG TPA: hypothetical protein VG147_07000 [Solirubrobacteraceae bacterium]|jgi:hypothetical protein|nr:hypothetical protein [Solirubrobacteraceae bacterium]